MAFSLNPAIHHIPVDETSVTGIFRSPRPQVPAIDGFQGHPCEAYVCTARDNDRLTAYIAILDTTTRLRLIYSSGDTPAGTAGALTDEALSFATSLGFAVEPVNLDYSLAMRQVIIRGLPVMRPPKAFAPAPPAQGEAVAAAETPEEAAAPPPDVTEQAAATAAPNAVVADLQAELNRLRHEQEKARAVLTGLRRTLAERDRQVEELRGCLRERDEALCVENGLRLRNEEEARADAAGMREAIADLIRQLEERNRAIGGLEADQQQRDGELRQLEERLRTAEERQAAALVEARDRSAGEWRRDRQQLERQLRSAEKQRQTAERQRDEALEAQAALARELEQERHRSAQELRSLALRLERMESEKRVCEGMAAGLRKKARQSVEKLRREKADLEARLTEASLPVQSAAVPKPDPFRVAAGSAAATAAPSSSPFGGPSGPAAPFSDPFRRDDDTEPLTFSHVPGLETPYCSGDRILDVYRSCNSIQAAPFGRPSQACSAFICTIRQEDGGAECYLAWHLADNGETLFCRADEPAASSAGRERLLRDAIYYFESVGFIMERFDMGRNSRQQLRSLEEHGVCRTGPSLDEAA